MSTQLIRNLTIVFHSMTPRERVAWLQGLNGHCSTTVGRDVRP